MKTYLVLWELDNGIVQSRVNTNHNPFELSPEDWVKLAALSEEVDFDPDKDSFGLYCAIDYPANFYE